MKIRAIKTRILIPPKDDLIDAIIEKYRPKEETILAITSKVVSIYQGRTIKKCSIDKDLLIRKEADLYLPRTFVPGEWVMHTIKDNLIIPTAGIDESNADGYYILWPKNVDKAVWQLRNYFTKHFKLKRFGIIITDSHSIPLRRGTVGISLSHTGFEPLFDYRQSVDLFCREMRITMSNVADSLASAAVIVMGEGQECTPIAEISEVPFVKFSGRPYRPRNKYSSFRIPFDEDLYFPFFKNAPWRKGGFPRG